MFDDSTAVRALREGRFTDAARLVPIHGAGDPEADVISLEVFYFLGHGDRTRLAGRKLLESSAQLSASLRSKAAAVLAAQYSDDGEFEQALDLGRKAYSYAQQANEPAQLCAMSALLLERTCHSSPFHAALPLALETRKHAVRCGDARVTAAVHLVFGRLEARAGHFDRARRHFALGRELLATANSLHLQAAFDLDESSVLSISGDLTGALDLAARAGERAQASGWSKGIVASAANCAFICVEMGQPEEADRHLKRAGAQVFKSPSYDVALTETQARAALLAGDVTTAESLLESVKPSGGVEPWYMLSTQETHIRVLLRQGRCTDALSRATQAITFAEQSGARPFLLSLKTARAEALMGLGASADWSFIGEELEGSDDRIGLVGPTWTAAAKGLLAEGKAERSLGFAVRARRLAGALGIASSQTDAEGVADGARHARAQLPSPDLDTAVALLELGGHTHILAREAVAVLEGAGCVRAMALVARGVQGPRVIEARTWDARQALSAAREPGKFEVIPLGEHREEPWELIVEPRPELEHRCTLVAIRKLLNTALTLDRYRRDEKQRAALWPAEALDGDPESIWASEQMSDLLSVARRIAPTPLSVLLTGETGTGKEMLARTIHRASDRADRAFLPFNCTAVPRDMLESQLFGYRKGAFTGADAAFPGVIRSAAGGTLFLDEIAEVGIDIQPKLLRFLETHEIHPLGEPQPIKVDVRVIAATNAPLEQLVADGRLREDLFYRLNVIRLKLPPLRERREEIPPLVDHYLRRYGEEQKKGRLTLGDDTLEYLLLYSWPGNVRQLANEVRRAVAMAEPSTTITPDLLSPEIQSSRRTIPATAAPADPEVRLRIDQPLPAAVQYLEQTMVRNALERSQGRVEEAAKLLGISRKGLFLKRKRWGLSQARPD